MTQRGTQRGRVLVVGASIAGPAAAYWLDRAGYDVTVLERAPRLRPGGQNIDVRGTARDVVDRMGVGDAVRARNTGEVGLRFVDESGGTVSEFPARDGDGDGPTAELEILRGALSEVLVDACPETVTWRFGDRVVGLRQDDDGVEVDLASGGSERFDLLVVADGVRSSTRGLVFGEGDGGGEGADPEVELHRLGMVTAFGTIPRTEDDDEWWRWLNLPGSRQVNLRPDDEGTTRAMLSYLSEDPIPDDADSRAVLREVFGDAGWETPRILEGFDADEHLYVDDLTQVRCRTWWRGRVCLLGDAAWCVTPIGGGGTSLAMVGGYVLASMLERYDGAAGPAAALSAYEEWMRPMVDDAQHLPPGTPRLAAPRSRIGVAAFRVATKIAASSPVQAVTGGVHVAESERALPPEPGAG